MIILLMSLICTLDVPVSAPGQDAPRRTAFGDCLPNEGCDDGTPCSVTCHAYAETVFTGCLARGEDVNICISGAAQVLSDCLVVYCEITPLLPPCEAECHQVGNITMQFCLGEGGDYLECAVQADEARLLCLLEECDAPCEDICQLQAEISYLTCMNDGGVAELCAAESELARFDCEIDLCNEAPPCPTLCNYEAATARLECIDTGGDIAICEEIADRIYWGCLIGTCGIEPPQPSCEEICQDNGQAVWHQCIGDGGSQMQCTVDAMEAESACLAENCTSDPECPEYCPVVHTDPLFDVAARPMDPAGAMPYDIEAHGQPDLLEMQVGRWTATDPAADLFAGGFEEVGAFIRLDLVLDGLFNPPGSSDPMDFNPFMYGERPVFGFVELDLDQNLDTGGEIDAPQFRYVGNAARFGGMVNDPAKWDRIATSSIDFSSGFDTAPYTERSGEEFHLALLGHEIESIAVLVGDTDGRFDFGETWQLTGTFFHRAHGYQDFSFIQGNGDYAPSSHLQFHHDIDENRTVISLVFPHSNGGAAMITGDPVQPPNDNPNDQASIIEALIDLQYSALFFEMFPTGLPEEEIVSGWATQDLQDAVDPRDWDMTALLGTSYTSADPSSVYFVWTDILPNVLPGDFDGNGFRSPEDGILFDAFVAENDAADGIEDESVVIPQFSSNFSLFDVNYDGHVNGFDGIQVTGDTDRDGDVDLLDFAGLQRCFGAAGLFPPCSELDFNGNEIIDQDDARHFGWAYGGPDVQ